MNMLKMNCPNCGAHLTYEDWQKDIVCSYCDSHVLIDDGKNHTVHIVDDTEMIRMQMERERAEKQRMDDLQKKKKKRILVGIWIGVSTLFILLGVAGIAAESGIALCFFLGIGSIVGGIWFHRDRKGAAQGKIRIPLDLGNYSDKHYKEVEASFRGLGFNNIQTIPLGDVVLGLVKKNGYVAGVTVAGKDNYSGFRFFPTAPVIIKYHSYHS